MSNDTKFTLGFIGAIAFYLFMAGASFQAWTEWGWFECTSCADSNSSSDARVLFAFVWPLAWLVRGGVAIGGLLG